MCVLHLIRRIGQLGPIVDAVCRYNAMRISETLTDVLIDEELSERIDGVLPEEMLLFTAEILNREPEDVKQGTHRAVAGHPAASDGDSGCVRDSCSNRRAARPGVRARVHKKR